MKPIVILYKGQEFSFPVTPKLLRRFFNKFTKGQVDECWEWQASRYPAGYGQIGFNLGKIDGKNVGYPEKAHRVSWQIFRGPLNGFNILHSCDNPPCINPHHLFQGTSLENLWDAIGKGRFPDRRKLTFSQAEEIRAVYIPFSKEFSGRALGRRYGIPFQSISLIIQAKLYKRPWKDQGSSAIICPGTGRGGWG